MAPSSSTWKTAQLASTYLENVRAAIPGAQAQLDLMATLMRQWAPDARRIVDLGCGDGILGRLALDLYPEATVWFADFSEPMLAATREKVGANPRCQLAQVDYGDPDWPSRLPTAWPADIVISGFSIHHQPDERKQRIYADIYAHLAPGGLFLNLEHCASATPTVSKVFDGVFVDHLVAYNASVGSPKTAEQVAHDFYYRPDKAENILAPVESQCDWLRAIGYEDVDIYYKFLELALFGGRRPA